MSHRGLLGGVWFSESAPCSSSAAIHPLGLGLKVLTMPWVSFVRLLLQDYFKKVVIVCFARYGVILHYMYIMHNVQMEFPFS